MDFWTDIAFAVLLRLLKDKAKSKQLRAAFMKLAVAIMTAFEQDEQFAASVNLKWEQGKAK